MATGGDSLLVADLVGVAVFVASGASTAIAKRLDLFGVAFVNGPVLSACSPRSAVASRVTC